MAKKRWSDLTVGQQRAVIVAGAVEVVVTVLAVADLASRPSAEVRGSKAAWVLSFIVQPFGPLAYFAMGRRPVDIEGS